MTGHGTYTELQKQLDWLNEQPHQHKVVIAGNHDRILDQKLRRNFWTEPGKVKADLRWGSILYLEDSSVILQFLNGRRLKIYGNPFTPRFGSPAFQYGRTEGSTFWEDRIPSDADVVLTHGPPKSHLDANSAGDRVGCESLLKELRRVKPQLVVFGHIHESAGQTVLTHDHKPSSHTRLVNASVIGDFGWLPCANAVKAANQNNHSNQKLLSPIAITI